METDILFGVHSLGFGVQGLGHRQIFVAGEGNSLMEHFCRSFQPNQSNPNLPPKQVL